MNSKQRTDGKYWKYRKTKNEQILYLIAETNFTNEYVHGTNLHIQFHNFIIKIVFNPQNNN